MTCERLILAKMLSQEGVYALVEFLKQNTTLTKLNLGGTSDLGGLLFVAA